jgi:L-ribulose-5-phosphate 3-epimerase
MLKLSRRFIGFVFLSFLLALPPRLNAQEHELKVGLQSYTLRNFDFDQLVDFAVKHQLKYLQTTDKHIDPKGTKEETRRKKEILDKHGLVCYTFGVAATSLNKEENRKLFEFAKFMGCKLIVVEPQDFKIWDSLEELVREYDIKLAIHNHGIKSLYGNPLVVRNIIQHRDPRIGVCLDAGWITAAGFDAGKVFTEYRDRVFDIHLKDKRIEKTKGDDVAIDTKIGEGNANLKGLLRELRKAKWDGVMAIETDSPIFAQQPAEFVDGALEFVKNTK